MRKTLNNRDFTRIFDRTLDCSSTEQSPNSGSSFLDSSCWRAEASLDESRRWNLPSSFFIFKSDLFSYMLINLFQPILNITQITLYSDTLFKFKIFLHNLICKFKLTIKSEKKKKRENLFEF